MTKIDLTTDHFKNQRLIVQSLRIGIFALILVFAVLLQLSQTQFFNWTLLGQFYLISGLGLSQNLVGVLFPKAYFKSTKMVFVGFLFDILLISVLMTLSQLSTSLFLFSMMIEIVLISFLFQTQGAFLLAAFSSLSFSAASLLGPDLKAMTYFFSLMIYNISFFAMAWLSGLLADQLEAQGLTLNTLRALNESIVDTIPSALLTVRSTGEILTGNPGASSLFHIYDFEGLHLGNISKILFEILEECTQASLTKKMEIPFVRSGDNLILSASIIPQAQDPGNFLVILEDITEIRRLELTVLHQQKLAAIGGLASGIAHELGNPLAAVSANIQYLEPKIQIEDDTDRKLIANTHKEIARLGRLIGEFKDYAKPEKIPVEPVRLHELLQEVVAFLQADKALLAKTQFKLDLQQVPDIRGHRDKLYQCFLNVLINALQAIQKDENKKESWVQVSCRVSGSDVVVRIRDNGVGMGLEEKTRLFEPFFTTKGKSGTGLGLAITYKIMQSHQAKISVDSTRGIGTEFAFRFPIPALNSLQSQS